MTPNIIDLIDDENLENALALREKYIENAAFPKKTIVLRVMKRTLAACLALLFLMIPASALLIKELLPHGYSPSNGIEAKASFKEMNDILGAEHLYNRLPEEYTKEQKIIYTSASLNREPFWNRSENFAANSLTDISTAKTPQSAEISLEYPNGDSLFLQLKLQIDDTPLYTGGIYTEIGGVTVYLDFEEDRQYAHFCFQGNTYSLSLESEYTDITHYLNILLEDQK